MNFFDRIRLRIAYALADYLAKKKIAPHQITLFRFVLTAPICGYFFSRGDYVSSVIGLAAYVFLAVLDWVDGRLARITNQLSALGKWLDETLDRVLVFIVLVSIFYAGIAHHGQSWAYLALGFFSLYFFVSVINADFDRIYGGDFVEYGKIEKEMLAIDKKPALIDRFLITFINVNGNLIGQFLFCISYLLAIGIITNQLFVAFIVITVMEAIRSLGLLFIMFRTIRNKEKKSALNQALKARMGKYTQFS